MLLSTFSVSAGSFLFWLIAARGADADVVGRSAGLFSAVFFLSFVTSLGLPVAVGRFAATAAPLDTLRFRLALQATALATTAGATLFVLADPTDLLAPVEQWGGLIGWFVMVLISVGLAFSVLVDVRLMGHRQWHQVFIRSTAIAVVRIPPLFWAVRDETGFWVFVIAAGGYAITALPYLPRLLRGAAVGPVRWSDHGEAIHYSGVNYLSQLAVQAPFFVTPLVVALIVGDGENATFYLSWGVMSVVYLGINLLGRTLLVEGSRTTVDVIRQARSTLAVGLTVSVIASLLSFPAGPLMERLYGSEHDDMSTMLPLLMLGTIPWVATRTALAIARAEADTRQTLAVAVWSAATVVGGVAVGAAVGDSVTAATGWLIGSLLALVVSLPTLVAYLRRRV